MINLEEMSTDNIVVELLKIKKKHFNVVYNVFDYVTNDITYYKNSRCTKFAIYFANKDMRSTSYNGILIELIKGNIVVSVMASSDNEIIDVDKILNHLPIRFKEIIAIIKRVAADKQKITKELVDSILNTSVKGIKNKYIEYIDIHEALNSIIQFNFLDLVKNKQKHTFIYVDKANFGKINRQKRASR